MAQIWSRATLICNVCRVQYSQHKITLNTLHVFNYNVTCISSGYLVMNSANCGYPQTASLLTVDHDFIIADHRVRINAWYMRFQYNIVNCKGALIWFILCHILQPVSGTVKPDRETVLQRVVYELVVKSCWGICINYSVLILILKYNKPYMLATGLESDAVCEQECGTDAIIIFSQEHFQNLQQHQMMKMPLPNRCIHSLNSREMCGGSRIPNGNLNVPLNKGSRKKQTCTSVLFCPVRVWMCM